MILPFPFLLRTQIQKRKKIALLGLFALGGFITVIQIIRIRTVKSLTNNLDSSSIIMWSTVENNLGIIVTCIPTLAPLFKYFAEKSQRSSTTKYAQQSRSMHTPRPWGTSKQGTIPLGSGINQGSRTRNCSRGGSEEFILGDVVAITKTTEVTISAHVRGDSNAVET